MATYLEFSSAYEHVDIPEYILENVGDFFEIDIDFANTGESFQMPFDLDYPASSDFFAITSSRAIEARIDQVKKSSATGLVITGRNVLRLEKTGAQQFKIFHDGVDVLTIDLNEPASPKITRINRGDLGIAPDLQWCRMNLYSARTPDRTYDLSVSDGSSLVETQQGLNGTLDTFTTGGFVTVDSSNSKPVANAGPNQSNIAAGSVVTLDGSASSDADGDPIMYLWSQTNGAPVSLSDPAAANPTFTAPDDFQPQTLVFSLIVNDGQIDSDPSFVSIDVDENGEQVGFDVIVLAGQSNMVGRNGPIDDLLDSTDTRIYQYGSTRKTLEIASDPLDHIDETSNTVGIGLSLAKHYADNYLVQGRKVLLVPVADGGTGFSSGFWRSGGVGYNNAIARANEALALGVDSRIVMIAWHQGESDKSASESQYATDLDSLIFDLRNLINGAADCPFIVGEVPPNSTQFGSGVAAALLDTPSRVANTAYVETSDLELAGDNLHFTASASRTMGVRYSEAFFTASNQSTITLNADAPNGTYKLYLEDQDRNEVFKDTATFSGGSATLTGLPIAAGAELEGFLIDNESPHVNGVVITGVTV